ncbi:hypothetical protein VOLCADRAFT_61240 [Volvox carteri f. nagariensis]|uniref:Carbonic anhydrase n=1 Tax=Volvox carteri f. nagariensis TaxID=3068 RepID=D8TYB5_VOLCA|nr:uncharacterized protein VOLCADRAFT_61240 [Volvox carteri f. nagariensis]EFJ47613.1 hypothetical protein VOLCADRAFT_61240 [Volvox carteri f. nagariensis]|eukprot:XP_002951437.1 hypothetical protein VOLCADRAFT_61240 [Volvox carteri f. nagariensis]
MASLEAGGKSLQAEFLENNAQYAAEFNDGQLPLPPARHALVLACMDARLHVEKVLGIKNGACHCVRNAGGRASDDALRSIVISQRLLGTKEVHIIHHTDCGMLTFTNEQLAVKIKEELGVDVGDRDFLPFPDLHQSVLDDIRTVRESPLVAPGTRVQGYIYEVETGKLRVVE